MNHRIEILPEKTIVGKKMTMTLAANRTAELWKSFKPALSQIDHKVNADLISLQVYPPGYFERFSPATPFEKWAAVEVSAIDLPKGMNTFIIPSGLYAVFEYKGLSTDNAVFQYIFGHWLTESEYELDHRPHFEILGDRYKNADPDSEEEIWVPILPKNISE